MIHSRFAGEDIAASKAGEQPPPSAVFHSRKRAAVSFLPLTMFGVAGAGGKKQMTFVWAHCLQQSPHSAGSSAERDQDSLSSTTGWMPSYEHRLSERVGAVRSAEEEAPR